MGVSKSLLEAILKKILGITKPKCVILFGSAANGSMTKDSDIDLLIIKSRTVNRYKESLNIYSVLRGLGYPFDVIVMSAQRFKETKNVIGGIAYPAHKYGKVIYGAA